MNKIITKLNEMNEKGKIGYADYSELFDLVTEALEREETVLKALKDVKAEIQAEERIELSVKEQYFNFALEEVIGIIDRKVNEVKGDKK